MPNSSKIKRISYLRKYFSRYNKKHRKIQKIELSRKELFLIGGGFVLIIFSFFVMRPLLTNYFYWKILNPEDLIAQNYDQVNRLLEFYRPIRNWSVAELDLELYSASAIEVHSDGSVKNLLEKNADHPYVIASITKLMTAMITIDSLNLDQPIIVSYSAANQMGGSNILREGDCLSVKNLLYLMLMESNNGAAYALAEAHQDVNEFISAMNKKANILGLKQTVFVTPSGLNAFSSASNQSTSHELTKIISYLWQNPDYEIIKDILATKTYPIYDETGAFYHRAINNNQLLEYYEKMVGGKTGYLPVAGECLISIFNIEANDSYLVIVVLGSKNRFEDTKKILEWIPRAYLYSSNYYDF